jgi:hypothetical protein
MIYNMNNSVERGQTATKKQQNNKRKGIENETYSTRNTAAVAAGAAR